MLLADRNAVLKDLRDLLGRAVALDAGLIYSHWELPPAKFASAQVTDGRIILPTVSGQVESVCYDPEEGAKKPAIHVVWPQPYLVALLNAQRWSRGQGELPTLPPTAQQRLAKASPKIRALFADQMMPVSHLEAKSAQIDTSERHVQRR